MYLTICVCVKVSKLMQYLFVKWPWVRMKSLLSVVLFCPSLVASFYSIPQCSNKSTEQSPTTFPADESIGLNNAFTPSFVNVSFSVCLRVCVWSKHTHPWKHVWLIEGWIEDEIRGKMRLNMNPSSQQDTQMQPRQWWYQTSPWQISVSRHRPPAAQAFLRSSVPAYDNIWSLLSRFAYAEKLVCWSHCSWGRIWG